MHQIALGYTNGLQPTQRRLVHDKYLSFLIPIDLPSRDSCVHGTIARDPHSAAIQMHLLTYYYEILRI